MNLRNKISNLLFPIFGVIILLGCEDLIYNKILDCDQGVYIKFYSATACDVDSLYPSEINNLHIYMFDANNKYTSVHTINNVVISKDYEFLIPIQKHGEYSFIAWSGINDYYILQNLQVGKTSKDELLLQLKRTGNIAVNIKGTSLFVGNSSSITLPDPESVKAPYYEHIAINMQEYTNHIEIRVEGLDTPQDYEVDLSIRNGDYSVKGDLLSNGDILHYPAEYYYENNTLSAKFTLLKMEIGKEDLLIVRSKDGKKVLFEKDFLTSLLSFRNPNIDMDCNNDTIIRFVIQKGTESSYYTVEVWVNDWLIRSYETGAGGTF